MTCEELHTLLLTAASADFDQYAEHLESCPRCTALALKTLAAEVALRDLENPMTLTFDDAWKTTLEQVGPQPRRSTSQAVWIALAAAAVVLLALWSGLPAGEEVPLPGVGEPKTEEPWHGHTIDPALVPTAAEAKAWFPGDPSLEAYTRLRNLSLEGEPTIEALEQSLNDIRELDGAAEASGSEGGAVLSAYATLWYAWVGLSIDCQTKLNEGECDMYREILVDKVHRQYKMVLTDQAVPRLLALERRVLVATLSTREPRFDEPWATKLGQTMKALRQGSPELFEADKGPE